MAIEQDNHQLEKKRLRGIEQEKSQCMRDNQCMRTGICPTGMVPAECKATLGWVRNRIDDIDLQVIPAGGGAIKGFSNLTPAND